MPRLDFDPKKEIVPNPAPRFIIVLCLDTSGSMRDDIDDLKRGVNVLYDTLRSNDTTRKSAEVGIVTFDNEVNVVEDFGPIANKKCPPLKAEGYTHIGGGILKACQMIDNRQRQYIDAGYERYKPWLIVMTDGCQERESPNVAEQAARRCKELESKYGCVIIPIAVSKEADRDYLSSLSYQNRMCEMNNVDFTKFFQWLSRSVIKTAKQGTGGNFSPDEEDNQLVDNIK